MVLLLAAAVHHAARVAAARMQVAAQGRWQLLGLVQLGLVQLNRRRLTSAGAAVRHAQSECQGFGGRGGRRGRGVTGAVQGHWQLLVLVQSQMRMTLGGVSVGHAQSE